MSGTGVIWIARKHPVCRYGTYKAFEIYSTHATRKEAAAVVKTKNEKAKDYAYTVGKVELK